MEKLEEPSATTEVTAGEKRKLEETIIPNTFKKLKSEHGSCQNGKKNAPLSRLNTLLIVLLLVDLSLLPEHDNIEIFLQDEWRQGLCKCTKVLLYD
jgi:E3 ubiquitin-protein ligase UBR7